MNCIVSLFAALYNNMEAFWRSEMRLDAEEEQLTAMHGKYKSRSDNVSYEDLLEFSEERRDIRLMQKVLGKEVGQFSYEVFTIVVKLLG